MKYLIVFILVVFFTIGCATVPKGDLLVRFPLKGEMVNLYKDGIGPEKGFVIDYDKLEDFIKWYEENVKNAKNSDTLR